jgi:hypothetical protein
MDQLRKSLDGSNQAKVSSSLNINAASSHIKSIVFIGCLRGEAQTAILHSDVELSSIDSIIKVVGIVLYKDIIVFVIFPLYVTIFMTIFEN